jgi:signal transduction histidine kinase
MRRKSGKVDNIWKILVGAPLAKKPSMPSFNNIYEKMVPGLEASSLAQLPGQPMSSDMQGLIGRDVAHELNNILTIIQGYTERMIMKQGQNSVMRPDLQLIADNARRAVSVIRQARVRPPVAEKVTA